MLRWTLTCVACILFLDACTPSRTRNWRDHGIRIVRSDELDLSTPQTSGMARAVAINHAMAGAKRLWAGTVTVEAGVTAGAHHHGELESIIYIIKGKARFRWGEQLEYFADAGPGDFIYVPPFVPHQEINPGDEPVEVVLIRSDQEPIVINLDISTTDSPEEVRWDHGFHRRSDRGDQVRDSAAEAIDHIKSLGARIKLDETQPLRPVIEINFGWNEKVRDDDLRHLKQFTKLHSLSLEATNISDVGLQHIRGLRDLKCLNLAATNCTDVSMGLLAGFSTLESLNIAGMAVTNVGLEHLRGLTQLKNLDLGRLELITDAGLVNLKDLTNLKHLELFETNITDAGIEHLKGLVGLEGLMLRWNDHLTGACLLHLRGMSNLQWLNLSGVPVTDADVLYLQGLTHLRVLSLRSTQVTDAALVQVGKFSELEQLSLMGTSISDIGIKEIKGLAQLHSLDLEQTRITDAAMTQLRAMLSLRDLKLGGTRMTSETKGILMEELRERHSRQDGKNHTRP